MSARCEYAPEGHGRCALADGHSGQHDSAANYIVRFGAYFCNRETFTEFVDALACFKAHYGERPERADLCGATHDGERDGLSEAERDAVETVQSDLIGAELGTVQL